jgi:5-dehydro-2-deoxygluconokinase
VSASPTYDLLTMGRSSIDLYANDIGAAFEDIRSFAAYVGGSPTNIAVGAQRLGLRTALLTAVGDDKVGDFILAFLRREGVETAFVPRKPGARSSAVVLGIEPPDRFPLVFYRDNAADAQLTLDDVLAAPVAECAALEVSGTGLARSPPAAPPSLPASAPGPPAAPSTSTSTSVPTSGTTRAPTASSCARCCRSSTWPSARSRRSTPRCCSGSRTSRSPTSRSARPSCAATSTPTCAPCWRPGRSRGRGVKRGRDGARIHLRGGETLDAPGYPVEVVNVLGAGDAFAAGFIYGRTRAGAGCGAPGWGTPAARSS